MAGRRGRALPRRDRLPVREQRKGRCLPPPPHSNHHHPPLKPLTRTPTTTHHKQPPRRRRRAHGAGPALHRLQPARRHARPPPPDANARGAGAAGRHQRRRRHPLPRPAPAPAPPAPGARGGGDARRQVSTTFVSFPPPLLPSSYLPLSCHPSIHRLTNSTTTAPFTP